MGGALTQLRIRSNSRALLGHDHFFFFVPGYKCGQGTNQIRALGQGDGLFLFPLDDQVLDTALAPVQIPREVSDLFGCEANA
jgi:hypothetical protein